MRGLLLFYMLLAAVLAITSAYRTAVQRPRPCQSGFPSFPEQGSSNPKPQPYPRFRRSAEDDKNKITANANKEGGKSSYQIDYERKIYENKHVSIGVNAGVNKNSYSKPQSHSGVGGSFSW